MNRLYKKGLTREEILLLRSIMEGVSPIFSTRDIKESRRFAHWSNPLINLRQKGFITQLEKGKYILTSGEADSFLIGTKLLEPASIAYYSALNHYGLTEQIPNVIYIQTTKRKKNKEILNVRYKFITVSHHKYFGIVKEWVGRDYYYITDMEKTIVDCFDIPENAGGFSEIVKGFILCYEKLDREKLWKYVTQLKNITVIKRIGYLSELFDLDEYKDFRDRSQKILLPNHTLLDPASPKKGRYSKKWKLILNLNEDEIKAMARTIV